MSLMFFGPSWFKSPVHGLSIPALFFGNVLMVIRHRIWDLFHIMVRHPHLHMLVYHEHSHHIMMV